MIKNYRQTLEARHETLLKDIQEIRRAVKATQDAHKLIRHGMDLQVSCARLEEVEESIRLLDKFTDKLIKSVGTERIDGSTRIR